MMSRPNPRLPAPRPRLSFLHRRHNRQPRIPPAAPMSLVGPRSNPSRFLRQQLMSFLSFHRPLLLSMGQVEPFSLRCCHARRIVPKLFPAVLCLPARMDAKHQAAAPPQTNRRIDLPTLASASFAAPSVSAINKTAAQLVSSLTAWIAATIAIHFCPKPFSKKRNTQQPPLSRHFAALKTSRRRPVSSLCNRLFSPLAGARGFSCASNLVQFDAGRHPHRVVGRPVTVDAFPAVHTSAIFRKSSRRAEIADPTIPPAIFSLFPFFRE